MKKLLCKSESTENLIRSSRHVTWVEVVPNMSAFIGRHVYTWHGSMEVINCRVFKHATDMTDEIVKKKRPAAVSQQFL